MSAQGRGRRQVDVIVIGAGQAGLAMGRMLQQAGREFLILDAAKNVGSAWRTRWDSLRLFTPARYSALPGMPFPADPDHYATKDEVAEYLEAYARAFSLPLGLDEGVRSVHSFGAARHTVTTDYARYQARHVVIATGGYSTPSIPAFAQTLSPAVHQLHSTQYRTPAQIPDGPVLVIGAGNTGVQLAAELSRTHEVTLASSSRIHRLPRRLLGRSVFEWLQMSGSMDATATSLLGRYIRSRVVIVGATPKEIARRQGVRLVPRIVRAEGNALRAADGTRLEPRTVLWATGFKPSYPWLHAPVLDTAGRPIHTRGITAVPGISFLGLPWQSTRGSSLIGWVARDAEYIARHIGAN